MKGFRLGILGIALGLGLAGCGQKGPLFLPPPAAAPQSRAPSDAPAERPVPRSPDDVPSTSEKK
ncbi:MAG TPA: lipoprotein [Burkholderiaceae bacterium]|nr:lipoprotein [Burkholderiaceae bacterium]HQR70552.1 lipoprotein [Burkholderiaceae bacterium]